MNLVQCRMARCALDWTTRHLAKVAGVSAREVQSYLSGADVPRNVAHRLRRAFEENGLVFLDEDPDGEGFGIRFQRPSPANDHPKPSGPPTDAVERMEGEIAADRQKPKR